MNSSTSTNCPIISIATSCGDISIATFAGKEKDIETGLSYFGARYSTSFRDVSWQRPQASLGALLLKRYYDADLITGWLSVDPMADKYPGMSPYNYCAGNPVRLVDPDGRDWYIPQGATEPVWQKNITEKNLPPGATYIGKTVGWSGQHDYDMGYAFHGDELGNLTCMDWESMRTATINYKDNSMKKISHYSMTVLFENMLASGVEQVTIDNRVSKYLCPFNDKGEKCHHIQIIQPK